MDIGWKVTFELVLKEYFEDPCPVIVGPTSVYFSYQEVTFESSNIQLAKKSMETP